MAVIMPEGPDGKPKFIEDAMPKDMPSALKELMMDKIKGSSTTSHIQAGTLPAEQDKGKTPKTTKSMPIMPMPMSMSMHIVYAYVYAYAYVCTYA